MRVYREYRCEWGHGWKVHCRKDDPELPEHILCPEGHEPITCCEQEAADEVQVLIRPASRIVDRTNGRVAHSGSYFLVLLDREDQEIRCSVQCYSWDEAIQLAGLYKGKTVEQALLWWERKPR
jgi:hypothetical protein